METEQRSTPFIGRASLTSWLKPAALSLVFLITGGRVQAEVPLGWDPLGYVTVKAEVDGQGPFDFVLDTGADVTGVYATFARRLNLPPGKAAEVTGATGAAQIDTAKIEALELDGQRWRDLTAVVLPD